jgi:hypothetical protein
MASVFPTTRPLVFLYSLISTISSTAVDKLHKCKFRGLVRLFRSRFGMSERDRMKDRLKESKKLQPIEGAGIVLAPEMEGSAATKQRLFRYEEGSCWVFE